MYKKNKKREKREQLQEASFTVRYVWGRTTYRRAQHGGRASQC